MIKIQLKRPIELPVGDRCILRPGIHSIPDDVFSHWFIQGMVIAGDVVVLDVASVPPPLIPKPKIEAKVRESGSFVKVGVEKVVVEEIKSATPIVVPTILVEPAISIKENIVETKVEEKSKTVINKRRKL